MDKTTILILAVMAMAITGLFGMTIAAELGLEGTEVGGGLWGLGPSVELPTQLCLVCPVVWLVLIILALALTPRYG